MAARPGRYPVKEVHMSRDRNASGHRVLWAMLILIALAGLVFWFIRERED